MNVRTLVRGAVLGTSLLLLAAAEAPATQILARALPELASDAGLVVEGRVVAQRSFWNDARTRILTEVEIQVDQAHKGNGPPRVSVVQMGGVIDGVRMSVHGSLDWQLDEEVLLFLEPSLPGRHRVAGFSQGKFEIITDERTGERWALRPTLLGVETAGGRSGSADTALRLPLRRVLEQAGLAVEEGR